MSSDKNSDTLVQRRAKHSNDEPLPREKLPESLQKIVDNEESLMEQIYDGTASQSTDSNLRYAAYATRLRTILLSAHRYVAYTSDIGESFRPVAHPWLVRGAYGISWAYLIGDVGHEGYKAYLRNQRVKHPGVPGVMSMRSADAREPLKTQDGGPEVEQVPAIEDFRSVMVQRAVFQSIASMGLPAFTIHSIVRYSGKALKDAKNRTIRSYGPIGLGLAAVPFLPFVFDKPVEEAVEWTFHKGFETFGGPDAVSHRPEKGRVTELVEESRKGAEKEKEL
ncbi:mitochondrial 18 KDa protein-domain-containing protein [Usnea florida]